MPYSKFNFTIQEIILELEKLFMNTPTYLHQNTYYTSNTQKGLKRGQKVSILATFVWTLVIFWLTSTNTWSLAMGGKLDHYTHNTQLGQLISEVSLIFLYVVRTLAI